MNQLFLFTCVVAVIGAIPLWYDAQTRPEYGRRPAFLLLATMLVAIVGIISFLAVDGMGENLKFYRANIIILIGIVYSLAFFTLEYSIHLQRISKSKLTDSFRAKLKLFWIAVGIAVALLVVNLLVFHGKSGVGLAELFSSRPITDSDKIDAITVAIQSQPLWFGAAHIVIAFIYFYSISVFSLQVGIIRLKRYPFIIAGIFTFVLPGIAALPFFRGAEDQMVSLFIVLNILFMVRVYHEYFFFRMHHLNDIHKRQEELEINRTELINKTLKSSGDQDNVIIQETLTTFLDRLKNALPNPQHVFKSMMLFRRNGSILAVDKEQFIIEHCTPLSDSETIKRMGPADLHRHIMAQVFEIDSLSAPLSGKPSDLGLDAFRQAFQKRDKYVMESIPANLRTIHKTIALYPVFNQDEIVGMVVLFKDSINYLFPQEDGIVKALVDNLSIILTIIEGKKMQEERNRLTGEMDIAKNIQTSVLPKQIVFPGYEVSATMVTASEVGGDVYDFKQTAAGNFLDIGDVSGHGLPAGMMALIQLTAFQSALETSEALGNKSLRPSMLYDILNRVLCTINRDRIGSDKFMTCNILQEKNGTFTHAGAHLTALLYRADSNKVVEQAGMMDKTAFLGLSEHIKSEPSEGNFSLSKGDLLVLYTDGAIEARDRNDHLFDLEGLKELVLKNAKEPTDQIVGSVLERLNEYAASGDLKKHGGKFADDISLVVLRKS